LARALIELGEFLGEADDAGRVVICHKISQSDLAALAGVARENVSRVMSDWKRRKVVTRSGGYYCLDAVETLKSNLGSRRQSGDDHGDEFVSHDFERWAYQRGGTRTT